MKTYIGYRQDPPNVSFGFVEAESFDDAFNKLQKISSPLVVSNGDLMKSMGYHAFLILIEVTDGTVWAHAYFDPSGPEIWNAEGMVTKTFEL